MNMHWECFIAVKNVTIIDCDTACIMTVIVACFVITSRVILTTDE